LNLASGYLTVCELEAMAHFLTLFSQLETSICNGFSMAMLNNQMVNNDVCWEITNSNGIIMEYIDEICKGYL